MSVEGEIRNRYAEARRNLWGNPVKPPVRNLAIPDPGDPDFILSSVAIKHKIGVLTLRRDDKRPAICRARDEACWRLRREARKTDGTRFSLTDIAALFDKHHTTIMTAIRNHQMRLDNAKK